MVLLKFGVLIPRRRLFRFIGSVWVSVDIPYISAAHPASRSCNMPGRSLSLATITELFVVLEAGRRGCQSRDSWLQVSKDAVYVWFSPHP